MEKILVSWENSDLDYVSGTTEVDPTGPTYTYHKHFFKKNKYDKHLLFCKEIEENYELPINNLITKLQNDFPEHKVEVRYLNLRDEYHLAEIKPKVEKVLLDYRRAKIDMLSAADSPVMSMAWYIAQAELELDAQVVELREGDKGKTPTTAFFKSQLIERGTSALHVNESITPAFFDEDYCYTSSIEPIYKKARTRIAPAESVTVFLSGETGTGKEHLAHYIHQNSPRSKYPFEAVSCAAMNDEELHTRLFGNARTGEKGAFDHCEGGTVFLDEVSDLSNYMQGELLSVLQRDPNDHIKICPLGGAPKTSDVRVITASNKDLYDLCQKGMYRWDLFYRLMVSELGLPPLRERGTKDLKVLFEYLLRKVGKEHGVSPLNYKSEVWDHLKSYSFPGNVRELLGIVQRFYVDVKDNDWISLSNFPPHFRRQVTVESDHYEVETIEDMERIHIDKIMRKYKGKSTYVAKALGIQPATLYNKMRKYNLVRSDYTGK